MVAQITAPGTYTDDDPKKKTCPYCKNVWRLRHKCRRLLRYNWNAIPSTGDIGADQDTSETELK